jgi:hypothetical protein
MKRIVLGVLFVAILALGASLALGYIKFNLGLQAGTCEADDEIAAADRKEIESTALEFARDTLGAHPGSAYALMTAAAQATTSPDKLETGLAAYNRATGPFFNVKVAHSYFVRSVGHGPDGRTLCGTGPQWISVAVRPGLEQAHVEVSADTRNNGWAVTLWLLPEAGNWRVQYFHLGAASAAGHTPQMLLDMARRERDGGHAFNADMLYAGLLGIVDRGTAFQPAIAQTARADAAGFQPPPELKGKAPFVWTMQGRRSVVGQVTIVGIGKDLGLIFVLPQNDWPDQATIDKRNRAFLDAFRATHRDYTRVFAFLVARAMKPDNSAGFGTVYQNGKGYMQ